MQAAWGQAGVEIIKLLYRWCKKQNKKLEKKRKNENENQRQTKLIIICGNNKNFLWTLQKIVGDDDCVILNGFKIRWHFI